MISSFTEYMIMHNVHNQGFLVYSHLHNNMCNYTCTCIYTCAIIYSCLTYMYSYLSTLKIRWMKLSDERKPKK